MEQTNLQNLLNLTNFPRSWFTINFNIYSTDEISVKKLHKIISLKLKNTKNYITRERLQTVKQILEKNYDVTDNEIDIKQDYQSKQTTSQNETIDNNDEKTYTIKDIGTITELAYSQISNIFNSYHCLPVKKLDNRRHYLLKDIKNCFKKYIKNNPSSHCMENLIKFENNINNEPINNDNIQTIKLEFNKIYHQLGNLLNLITNLK